jgi:hypothetical protein
VRLEDSTRLGESVMLGGLDFVDGFLTASESPAAIVQSTGLGGTELVPPRSLLLDGQVCFLAHGGGVFSSDTGALIGVIAWGSKACDDPEGTTVALKLAPFRRFLLEVIDATSSEPLRSESRSLNDQKLQPCASRGPRGD